jgi:hypothetical protein
VTETSATDTLWPPELAFGLPPPPHQPPKKAKSLHSEFPNPNELNALNPGKQNCVLPKPCPPPNVKLQEDEKDKDSKNEKNELPGVVMSRLPPMLT